MSTVQGGVSFAGLVETLDMNAVESVGFSGDRGETVLRDAVAVYRFGEDSELTFGYNTRLAGRFNTLDLAASKAYDGLFMDASALNSPYLALSENADLMSYALQVDENLTVAFGRASQSDGQLPRLLFDGGTSTSPFEPHDSLRRRGRR